MVHGDPTDEPEPIAPASLEAVPGLETCVRGQAGLERFARRNTGPNGNVEVQIGPRAFLRAAAGTQIGLDNQLSA